MGWFKDKEPAVVIGVLAAAVLALLQSLAGNGVIGTDLVDTIGRAIDPNRDGWALPIILGIVTRFFVFAPATVKKLTGG